MRKTYIALQLGGWLLYIILAIVTNMLQGQLVTIAMLFQYLIAYLVGVLSSHLYRNLIIKLRWTELRLLSLIPRVLVGSVSFAFLFQLLYVTADWLFFGSESYNFVEIAIQILNWTVLFVLWSVIYFAFHFFQRYKSEEIKNLTWEAHKNEVELNKLKSQLNPHFIFNSMNTIRALIDEDPVKAKKSVTQLSNLLRNTLLMGRKKTVPFSEEWQLVQDYVDLEKKRYEERLQFEADIDQRAMKFEVPGMIVQTMVENSIKHGIAHLPEGGEIRLKVDVKDDELHVCIVNPGKLGSDQKYIDKKTGFGVINTRQRLDLLYGEDADFQLRNGEGETVETYIKIPNKTLSI
ncbi:histidine kinase [Salibacter sp.]|uniref:sensor histidine kinase n=1 Tax=Salibacter sp. TaxID=2010995 RepID=UPI002870420C|nr:histidine kinase [Salibacter sp.]MDR9398104.1 histidine kinase [Salibacter sp.]MDR9487282.1 histidine kinase [Salibacter sp.]